MPRERADRLLVGRGLAVSVEAAARKILAGEVFAGSDRVRSPGQLLETSRDLNVRAALRYVSRGGEKLAAALDHFAIVVAGRVCLDAGASTGGFTDCLLQRGAARVYAVDVAYGQLAWSLRRDPRVVVMERTNVRLLKPGRLDPVPDLIVADLAFISLRTVLPSLVAVAAAAAELVVLVKPQFELPRKQAAGGVVRDTDAQRHAVMLVEEAARELGLGVVGSLESPLLGPKGNREYLLVLRRTAAGEADR